MPSSPNRAHADLFLRLDDLPIPPHERELAKAQARLAFRIADALCDGLRDLRALAAWPRRHAMRAS